MKGAFLVLLICSTGTASADCLLCRPNFRLLPQRYVAPAPSVLVPQVRYEQLDYDGTTVQPLDYRTPIRDFWFGRERIWHHYAPRDNQRDAG